MPLHLRRCTWFGCSLSAALAFALGACAADADAPEPAKAAATSGAAVTAIEVSANELSFQTQSFTLEPGQERFLCFASTLDQDVVVQGFSSAGGAFVHHVVLVRTLVPEPDGMSECDVLFRQTWDPLFVSGTGQNTLEFPQDSGHEIKAGTQLVTQLHLLNASAERVTGSHRITMQRTTAQNPRPIGTMVFGRQDLSLPPGQHTEVQADCQLSAPAHLLAVFPHMHMLGSAMHFEVGSTQDSLKELFVRDPYDFDNQHMDMVDLELAAGAATRVRCSYDNDTDKTVTFGESSHSEMCFFVGFALDSRGLQLCRSGAMGRR